MCLESTKHREGWGGGSGRYEQTVGLRFVIANYSPGRQRRANRAGRARDRDALHCKRLPDGDHRSSRRSVRPTRLGARSPRFVNPLWPIQHRFLSHSLSLCHCLALSHSHTHSILFEGSPPLSLSRGTHSLLTLTQRAAARSLLVLLFCLLSLN